MSKKDKKNSYLFSNKTYFISFVVIIFLAMSLFTARRVLVKNRPIISNDQNLKVLAASDGVTQEKKKFASIPVLREGVEFPIVSARSVFAIDLDSGISLYQKDPDIDSLPASTTKIMTAVVAMEHYDPAQEITVENGGVVGQKMGLGVGEIITVDSLIKGLLIGSANDAAEILAINYDGGRDEFVEQMNEKSRNLRLTNTVFTNPSGLDELGQTTTARDLMKLSTYAMQKPYFANIVGTKQLDIQSVDGQYNHRVVNTNLLLGKVDGVLGTKTGWTENAQENLVTYIEKYGRKVIIVLLGSQDRFGETEHLIDWIFSSYDWMNVDMDV